MSSASSMLSCLSVVHAEPVVDFPSDAAPYFVDKS